MVDFHSRILTNEAISPDFYRMRFSLPETISPQPGQFFSIKDLLPSETLLRRPFAFSNAESGFGEMIYQLRGKATKALSTRKHGDFLKILLPCGNSFPLKTDSEKAVLVSGGVGLGPMIFLEKKLRESGYSPLFVAGFQRAQLIPTEVIPSSTFLCTDDGSQGFQGNTIEALKSLSIPQNSVLYGCGPTAMLRALSQWGESKGLTTYVSLEAMMGCSLGACMGCVVPTNDNSYKRVCKEGPIFDSREILWTSM